MDPFRRHLVTQDPAVWRDDEPYIFMDADDLEAERQVLLAALPHRPLGPLPTVSLEAATRNAWQLARLARFGAPPTPDALTRALARLPVSQSQELRARLEQVGRALGHARRFHGRDYDSTRAVAVNPRWDRRWDALLGGSLLMAFLGWVPVDRF